MTGSLARQGGELNVSRETLDRFALFESLLRKWTTRINLVSRASLDDLWNRHILDSAQVFDCAKPGRLWVDLGSGGGFPGLVVAILAAERAPDMQTVLVESDQRKAAFLRAVMRETGVKCRVLAHRIEEIEPIGADTLSARALAELDKLLEFSERHLSPGGTALFPKGVRWRAELERARRRWHFDVQAIKSRTEDGAVILKIKGVSRA